MFCGCGLTTSSHRDPSPRFRSRSAPRWSDPHIYDEYGPFYVTTGLVEWLKISRQAIAQRAKEARLLAVRTADNHTLYPAWQFDPTTRQVPKALQDVLAMLLPAAATPWTAAVWLCTPLDPNGDDAIAEIKAGLGDRVLRRARRDATRWAR